LTSPDAKYAFLARRVMIDGDEPLGRTEAVALAALVSVPEDGRRVRSFAFFAGPLDARM